MTLPKNAPCKCGCGQTAPHDRYYLPGHNMRETINPAGMTLERALEIATAVAESHGPEWGRRRSDQVDGFQGRPVLARTGDSWRVNSGRPAGQPLSSEQREQMHELIRQGRAHHEIALIVGCSTTTVSRHSAARWVEKDEVGR